jgi:hypothetical protein
MATDTPSRDDVPAVPPAAPPPPVQGAPGPTRRQAVGSSALRVADVVLDELRAGLALVRAGRFHPPPLTARARRVFYPLGVIVALWRSMWGDAPLRRRYLNALMPQAALVIAAGIAFVFYIDGVDVNINVTPGNFTVDAGEKVALSLWAIILSLYTAMSVFEWIVIALTREHHDALSYAVSTAVGVPPEEDIQRPRVRLDVDWLVTKMKRRLQGGIILLVSVLPFGMLITVVFSLAPFGANAPSQLFTAVVGSYWLGVFTLGKTAHAWRDEIVDDPFFLRLSDRYADKHPRLLGWLHLYVRILRRVLGRVRRPAHVVESATFETAGLVLLRILISLPGVYVLLRPLIPVASTVVIAARSPQTLKGLPLSLVLEERLQ